MRDGVIWGDEPGWDPSSSWWLTAVAALAAGNEMRIGEILVVAPVALQASG